MPTLTNADALLKAANDMQTALWGGVAQASETTVAIEKLMEIFKQNATREKSMQMEAGTRRQQMHEAQRQRAQTEDAESNTTNDWNVISQDELDSDTEDLLDEGPPELVPPDPKAPQAPAYNTRSQASTRSITQEVMLMTMDISSAAKKITPSQAASRKYPLEFLCEYAEAVLDGATGELLEYRHLIKHPKYKDVWGHAFGDELGRLCQGMPGRVEGTDTFFFIHKHEVPLDRRKDVTYDRICC